MIAHHGLDGQAAWNAAVAEHEAQLAQPLLDYLAARNDVRLLGPSESAVRHPTISFAPATRDAGDVGQQLGVRESPVAPDTFMVIGWWRPWVKTRSVAWFA